MPIANITVLGGLPVTVSFRADRGYGDEFEVTSWRVTHVAGRKCKTEPLWLYRRMDATKRANEQAECDMLEAWCNEV